MPLAFAEVAIPAEVAVPRSCPCALAGVGRRRLPASKFLYLGFMWEREMRLEAGSRPSPAFLRHPDCLSGLRFPGGQGESWLWSLGIGPGEVSGKCGSRAVLQRVAGQPPHLSKLGSLEKSFIAAYFFFFLKHTFLLPAPPLHHPFFIISSSPRPLLPSNFSPSILLPLLVSGWAVGDIILFQACSLAFVLGEH